MQIKSLGHVVLKVSDQEKSEAFYNGVLGLPIVARYDERNMTFFSLGDHHDFAIMALGDEAEHPASRSTGLAHVAFKIGESLDELREARGKLDGAGIKTSAVDHEVTKSLYFNDPDGNGIEVYVDVSDAWRDEPQVIAQGAAMEL